MVNRSIEDMLMKIATRMQVHPTVPSFLSITLTRRSRACRSRACHHHRPRSSGSRPTTPPEVHAFARVLAATEGWLG
jgi:hypothetical protein